MKIILQAAEIFVSVDHFSFSLVFISGENWRRKIFENIDTQKFV